MSYVLVRTHIQTKMSGQQAVCDYVIGPFETEDQALDWADEVDNSCELVELEKPE